MHVKTLDNFDYKVSFYSFTYVVPTTNKVCLCFLHLNCSHRFCSMHCVSIGLANLILVTKCKCCILQLSMAMGNQLYAKNAIGTTYTPKHSSIISSTRQVPRQKREKTLLCAKTALSTGNSNANYSTEISSKRHRKCRKQVEF